MTANPYETPRLLAEYLLLHYGSAADVLGSRPGPVEAVGFPTRLVRELLAPVPSDASALDVGCAVGGSAFELARSCARVVGIDFSHAFIAAADHLRTHGAHPFDKPLHGTLTEPAIARVPADLPRDRCAFEQGDATALRADLGAFDVVLAANLICRLPDPRSFLERLPDLVVPGGQLLLTTPFTWMDEYTPRDRWIGGTPETGASFEALRAELGPHFALELTRDIPLLIREHERKFQYTVALGSRWRRL